MKPIILSVAEYRKFYAQRQEESWQNRRKVLNIIPLEKSPPSEFGSFITIADRYVEKFIYE